MASRYWVGTSNPGWNNVAGSKWSASSGGASGASAPGPNDDVFLDANSSAGDPPLCIVTLTDNVEIKSLTLTGFTGQLVIGGTPFTLTINAGGIVAHSSMSFVNFGILKFTSTSGTRTVSADGGLGRVIIDGVGGTFNVSASQVNELSILGGTVTLGSCNFGSIISSGSGVRSLSLGSATLTQINSATFLDPITFSGSNFTFDAGTSSILVNNSNGPKTFAGGGKTFYDVTINNGCTISGSNTFHALTIATGQGVTFTAGTTQTIGTFTADGGSGSVITLQSSSAGSSYTLSAAALGTLDYLAVTDCSATGTGTEWKPTNSIGYGGNTGWIFGNVGLVGITD